MNKMLLVKCTAATALVLAGAPAFAVEGSAPSIFDSVDLSGVQEFVLTSGSIIIGIALSIKGIDKAKQILFRV